MNLGRAQRLCVRQMLEVFHFLPKKPHKLLETKGVSMKIKDPCITCDMEDLL